MALIESEQGPNRSKLTVSTEVMKYDPVYGIGSWWEEEACLRLEVLEESEEVVVISGNPEGLVSLARHLLTLAQAAVPNGRHLDFDTYCGSLDEGSMAIRIEVEKN